MTNKQSYVNEKMKYYQTLIPHDKYYHPGVYSITVNNEIVYVGKARNMLERVAAHMYYIMDGELTTDGMKFKYGELRNAHKLGYKINFNVLYTSSIVCGSDTHIIDDDIGPQEAKYINQYLPKLNKQIPNLDNYHKFTNKKYEILNLPELRVVIS